MKLLMKNRQTGGIACSLVAVIAFCGQATSAPLYVIGQPSTGNTTQNTSFGSIDTVSGIYTSISTNVASGTTLANLAYDPVSQKFYTATGVNTASNLATLTTSGSLATIGSIGKNLGALWYDTASGTLSAFNRTNAQVGTVSTLTGTYTSTASSNANFDNFIGGRGAFLSGTAFLISPATTASASKFGYVSLVSGSFSTLGTGTAFQRMVLASDGSNLYGVLALTTGSSELYSINATNGSLSKLMDVTPASGNMPLQFSGAVFAVPEPSAIALAVAGVVLSVAASLRCRSSSRGERLAGIVAS